MIQPSHWTYCSFEASDDLRQGDIIRRTPPLLDVLSQVLPYFCDERYVAFMVLTQSCDLVQRDRAPSKAGHVNLCVIRELEPLLPAILEPCCGAGVPGVFLSEGRWHAEQLLKKVLNQNDQVRGLFYLHPVYVDPDHADYHAGIGMRCVALLRVSIALRREHYRLLQESRCVRLSQEYAAKLGWLAGNLYSRVATPDWEDQEKDKRASSKQAQFLLQQVTKPEKENWVPSKWIKAARDKELDLCALPADRFRSTLARHAPPELIEVVLDAVQQVARGVLCDALSQAIADSNAFVGEVARQTASIAAPWLTSEERVVLAECLAGDTEFRAAIGNQVASVLKPRAAEVGEEAISELQTLLAETTGMLPRAVSRLKAIVVKMLGADSSGNVDEIVGVVRKTCVFSSAAVEQADAAARDAFSVVGFWSIDKLVSRLKNDQKLRAACRGQSIGDVARFELD